MDTARSKQRLVRGAFVAFAMLACSGCNKNEAPPAAETSKGTATSKTVNSSKRQRPSQPTTPGDMGASSTAADENRFLPVPTPEQLTTASAARVPQGGPPLTNGAVEGVRKSVVAIDAQTTSQLTKENAKLITQQVDELLRTSLNSDKLDANQKALLSTYVENWKIDVQAAAQTSDPAEAQARLHTLSNGLRVIDDIVSGKFRGEPKQ